MGQACYIHRGTATYVQVARPRPSPLSLAAAADRLSRIPAARTGQYRSHDDGPPTRPLPVPVPAGLDDVLGPEGTP